MQNFSIADYCYERVDKIKAFNDYIGEVDDAQSNPISSLRSKKRRTTSFRRYSIPRKRRLVAADVFKKHRYSNITRCRKHIRRFALKSKQSKSYRRLETNVWYAKRFKMTTKWGYRLPTRSSSMGLKSLWKRAKTSAVLSDNSYYPVLELLCIDIDALAPFLSKFLAPNSYILESILSNRSTLDRAGTKNNSIVESGFILRELETLFYDPRATPPSLVGPVSFTFIPSESESTDSSLTLKIWLRTHPSIHSTVLKCISSVLDGGSSIEYQNKIIFKGLDSVVHLNRFTILGHKATDILRRVMLVSESAVKKYDQSSEVISNQSSSSSYSGSAILNDHESKMPISNQRRKKLLQQARLSESSLHQSNESFFTHIISLHRINQSVWPHGQLLSLNIKDCRHIKFNKDIFQKELKADADTTEITGRKRLSASALKHKRKFENMKSKLTPWPSSSQIISSPLFTDVGRAQAAFRNKNDLALSMSARIREVTISSIQSTELSPNNKIEADDNVSNTIPIILIRRDPGYHFSSSSTSQEQDRRADTSHRIRARRDWLPVAAIGWDIIIPDHWGPSIWRALIFAGATAVGIEEVDRLQLLSAQPSFPRDYPDTPAGVEFWAARLRSLNKRNRLRPRRKQALSTVEYVPNWSSISKVFQLNRYRTSTMSSPAPTATDDNIHSEEPDSKPVDNNSLEHLNTINRVIRLKSDFSCYQPFTYSTIKNTAQSNIQTVTLAPEPRLNVTSGLVTLLIHIPGKGRSLDGAKILTPTSSDYDAWLSHRRSKQVPSLSRRLRGQRCSGDWTGVDLEILSKVRDKDREEQRMIIGYVTSGENDGGSHKCAGIGCVDSLELFRCIQQFYHLSQASITDKDPDDIHTINTHTFSSMESSEQIMMSGSIQNQGWRSRNGSRSTLVLLHNPYSRWLRPALVEYVLWDQL